MNDVFGYDSVLQGYAGPRTSWVKKKFSMNHMLQVQNRSLVLKFILLKPKFSLTSATTTYLSVQNCD